MTLRQLTITSLMVGCWLLAGSCAIDDRDLDVRPLVGSGGTPSGNGAGASPSEPGKLGAEVYPGEPTGQEGLPPVGGIQPVDVVSGGAASCRGDAGSCRSAGDAGSSLACVPTGLRDCTSDLDNDCDGRPDNTVDDVCVCTPGSEEPCDEHPALDGRGQCKPGARTCIAGPGNLTSDWGACEGAVGPGEEDSCSVLGDDTNCDGTDNGGCPCVESETRPCGPDTENGICLRGTQTCVNGGFGQCEGAVFPAPRNCGSQQDNDCDGRPDNAVDNVCTCAIGSVQACGAHPGRDGNGPCQAGSQTCAGRANNSTSGFGACAGSVGPALQDTCAQGNDANCNGITNEGCACVNGNTRACGPDTDVGACQRGTQTCVNGAFGQCQGAVFPAVRDCGSPQDNDCDGRPDNTLDNVCRLGDGQTCRANGDCVTGLCASWALSGDGDAFGRSNTLVRTCGASAPPRPLNAGPNDVYVRVTDGIPDIQRFDCCDTERQAFPGQTAFFTRATGCGTGNLAFDFNCDGTPEPNPPLGPCTEFEPTECPGVVSGEVSCGGVAAGSACFQTTELGEICESGSNCLCRPVRGAQTSPQPCR
jgi:hypothetical protein